MARVNAKQPAYDDPAVSYLDQLSKSALIDVIVDSIKRDLGLLVAREDDAMHYVEPVLLMRGDRVPLSSEEKADRKAGSKPSPSRRFGS